MLDLEKDPYCPKKDIPKLMKIRAWLDEEELKDEEARKDRRNKIRR